MASRKHYTVGGTVAPNDEFYIHRRADDELLALCREGQFAYVLTSRQMGKSSLMVRTATLLEEEDIQTVILDLTRIGVNVDPEEWHLGILTLIRNRLQLETDMVKWWYNHAHFSVIHRFMLFFEKVLLEEVAKPIVIFIDEIDTTLRLPFTDDFFAAIRFAHNNRAIDPSFKRLSFVLIGVATPNDLISDPIRTPFNIGERVDLTDFTLDEAKPLNAGLGSDPEKAKEILRWIIAWTGGHPYLTQRVCREVANQEREVSSKAEVDSIVASTFFGDQSTRNHNLIFVRDMLTKGTPDISAVLATYRKIRNGKRSVPDEAQSLIKSHLKLSGIVKRDNGSLIVRNTIYKTVFDNRWINDNWPEHWIKRIPIQYVVATAAVILGLLVIVFYQNRLTVQAQENAASELALREVADSLYLELEDVYEAQRERLNLVESLNRQLQREFGISDSLREESDLANKNLSKEKSFTDSLNSQLGLTNESLSVQVAVSESLRALSADRLEEAIASRNEATESRRETITVALAQLALRQQKLGDTELGALLAHQAYQFFTESSGEFLDQVYEALRVTLNALATDDLNNPQTILLPEGWVRQVAYSPDGRWLVSAWEDGKVRLWDLTSNPPGSLKILGGHVGTVRSLAFSPDGEVLASAGEDGNVIIWKDIETAGSPHATLRSPKRRKIWVIAFDSSGEILFSAGEDAEIVIWNWRTQSIEGVLPLSRNTRIKTLAFSPESNMVLSGSEDGMLQLWELKPDFGFDVREINVQQGSINAIAFSPDNEFVAIGGDSTFVELWKLNELRTNGQPFRELRGHESRITTLAFSTNGQFLASGSSDGSVQLWHVDRLLQDETASINPSMILQDQTAWILSIGFSPNSRHLASGSQDNALRIWNIDPRDLDHKICERVTEELSQEEWNAFIGEDLSLESRYACSYVLEQVNSNNATRALTHL